MHAHICMFMHIYKTYPDGEFLCPKRPKLRVTEFLTLLQNELGWQPTCRLCGQPQTS